MRVYVALFFLFCACFGPFAARAEVMPTADELEARNKAAVGADPDNVRETVVSTGSLGDTKTMRYTIAKDERRTFDRGGLHSESGTYQGERWQQNTNGLTVIIGASEGKEAAEKTTTTVMHVTAPVDAYVVSRENIRREGTRTFYDAATNRIIRTETFGPDGTTVETVDDVATFGSLTRPKHWSVTSATAHLAQHYERTEFALGAATAADVVEPPTRRTLVEFPAGTTDVTLPVLIDHNDIIVRLMFGTRGADFILDTGASVIFFDQGLATQLGLKLTNATSEVMSQRFTRYDAIVPEIGIGPLRMHNVAVTVGPLASPGGEDVKVVGLLGFDFLAQLGVTIDYQNKRLRVTPAALYQPPHDPGTYEIPVRLGESVPETTVSVGNAVAEHMLFDTGGAGNIAFFDYFTRRYPQTFHNDLGRQPMLGVGGMFYVDLYTFPEVSVGPIHFRNFVGMRMPADSYTFDGDGIIGNSLLSLFTVGLDYTNARIFLTLNDAGKADVQSQKRR